MDGVVETSSKPIRRKGHVFLIYGLFIIIVGGVAGWYAYHDQHDRLNSLTSKNANLSTQLATLDAQIDTAKAANNVTTSGWETYCDPHGVFCFKYPPGWTVNSSYSPDVQVGTATITNPSKTLTVGYLDNYLKDGFAANFIVHSISALSVGNDNLALLSGYYISTVGYTPQYEVVNVGSDVSSPVLSDKAGQNIFAPSPPGFQYSGGAYNSTIGQFYAQPDKLFPTAQQASAWYNSIDGKTAYQIISSLSAR